MSEPRYWKLHPATDPGDVVAEHDGGIGRVIEGTIGAHRVDASGPGNYTVVVRRAGKRIEGDDAMPSHRPIELHSFVKLATGQPFRFNTGMARWFGLRLIEAAEICEAFDVAGGASPSVAPAEIAKLVEWMQQNAADWIGDGSAVDNAIRLMGTAKQILAESGQAPPVAPTAGRGDATPIPTKVGDPSFPEAGKISLRGLTIGRLRDAARKVIDEQSAPAAMELRAVLREAIAAKMVTLEDYRTDVLGYFTPNEQTILRGRTDF